ncbi:hypothetical protein [Mesorhizobium sp.]|jgi:hypothetical protein|uniref:hypothetical protein n=1 Tax=Mesorhizobium sp. TaxID=1871066 RepID=UPI000FE3B9CA|nr:hypothetical protein [Mesorhizobium sp.]RWH66321.1 MAG: hypothetical protein EOQ84_31400 [Mesorhizobium sp.]RWL20992.1 MAG: hypothetical protein EOR58_30490 [Mesorhizobium sp.]RWL24017.1 MAG: hypothetical protein EOR63_31040 [Mesorhizobium sp.]RWL28779.1 MAG: hypothetical protein EOR59_30575 [Mesorhizobium sp.]RWL47306.1 MAG: hypothetical protein EOR62_28510 [Mesorhizobium sp.]
MRNFPVLLLALGGLTAFVIPAAAESDHGSCAAAPAASSATIDLESIPVMSATGLKSVKGVGDDECGDVKSVSGARSDRGDAEFGDSDD